MVHTPNGRIKNISNRTLIIETITIRKIVITTKTIKISSTKTERNSIKISTNRSKIFKKDIKNTKANSKPVIQIYFDYYLNLR